MTAPAHSIQQRRRATIDPEVRKHRAKAGAYANIAKNGTTSLGKQLRSGFMRRFERQIDELAPGLRNTNPKEYAVRVAAALASYMSSLAVKSATARQAKAKARKEEEAQYTCLWCDPHADGLTSRLCKKHQRAEEKRTQRIHERIQRQAAALAAMTPDERTQALALLSNEEGAGYALHIERLARELVASAA